MKDWTIMIYMAGDNNLAVDMAYALEQIRDVAAAGDESPNLFVYYDGNSPVIPTLYCDFSDPVNPKYVPSYRVPDKLHDVPNKTNENAADFRSIINFTDWCMNKVEVEDANGEITYGRRAHKYAFIFSGHSLGFQDIGLFRDETSGKTMKMNDLAWILTRLTNNKEQQKGWIEGIDLDDDIVKRDMTVLIGQPIDLLGFDACVMGMLEVGYQFSTVAKTMIASEGSVPSAGWTYAKILKGLVAGDGGNTDSNAVAERFVRNFIESQDAFTVGGVSVDMAAWDLSKILELAKAFDNLAAILIDCFAENDKIYRQMERVILQVHWKCQSYMYDQNVDLGDFCELLDKEIGLMIEEMGYVDRGILNDVQDCCRDVLERLRAVVILSGFSGGEYQYSNGISVFFPWSREGYEVSRENYEELLFVKDTGRGKALMWSGFLRKYLQDVALRKFDSPETDAENGTKYRYYSGFPFDDDHFGTHFNDTDKKLAGSKDSKLAGSKDSKLAGSKDSKLAGSKDSKLAGSKDSKLAGSKDSKLAGSKDSKMAGSKDSKLAGSKDSKMGGSGSSSFFDNLRLFKNIESRWNISGFTKKPE